MKMDKKIKPRMGARMSSDEVLELYLYGDVRGGGYDWWTGEAIECENSAAYFREVLASYPNVKEITLYINSYGGDVFEGTAIANQLRRHSATVCVMVDGFACSIASVIAMAGDKVVMPKNAVMMIHNMYTYAVGNAQELRKVADDLDVMMCANRSIYLEKAGDGLTEEHLIELLDAETFLTADECLALGFCDEVVEAVKLDEALLDDEVDRLEEKLAQLRLMAKEINEFCTPCVPVEETIVPAVKPTNYLGQFFN